MTEKKIPAILPDSKSNADVIGQIVINICKDGSCEFSDENIIDRLGEHNVYQALSDMLSFMQASRAAHLTVSMLQSQFPEEE